MRIGDDVACTQIRLLSIMLLLLPLQAPPTCISRSVFRRAQPTGNDTVSTHNNLHSVMLLLLLLLLLLRPAIAGLTCLHLKLCSLQDMSHLPITLPKHKYKHTHMLLLLLLLLLSPAGVTCLHLKECSLQDMSHLPITLP
jgi:hypothetical protein